MQHEFLAFDEFLTGQSAQVWALIDGVNCPDLAQIAENREPICLYNHASIEAAPHAPWLLPLDFGSPAAMDLATLPGDSHWGILFVSDKSAQALRAHFRKFTMIQTPGNPDAPGYFRFYDPGVMLDVLLAFDPDPDHVAALVAPMSALVLPLSPQLGGYAAVPPCAPRSEWRGKMLTFTLNESAAIHSTRPFAVSGPEFERMEKLQAERSILNLARFLHGRSPERSASDIQRIAEAAPECAGVYGMKSIEQVYTYARAMLILGTEFDSADIRAHEMLIAASAPWQKADRLSDFMNMFSPPYDAERLYSERTKHV